MSTHVQDRRAATRSGAPAPAAAPTASPALGAPWTGRRIAALTVVSLAAVWGLAAGWWTPRGPLTSSAAIWSIVISIVVGGVAGFALRSRWAMLLAPATFLAVFELTRLRVDGPMVDGIHASFYGAIALITGRGFHALLALVPMSSASISDARISTLTTE